MTQDAQRGRTRGPGGENDGIPPRAALVLVFALVFVSYLPVRHATYVQDDHLAVEHNPVVERGSLREIFATDYWGVAKGNDRSLYRPLTILSYALERSLTGTPSPFVSHAVNVLLHALVCALLLGLALSIGAGRRAAAAAALLFAVHPIHVEAVANVVGRAELLASLFTLGALLCHGYHAPGRARAWRLSLATGCFTFLALASKEVAIVTPLLLLAQDLLLRPPRRGAASAWLVDRGVALSPALAGVGAYLTLRTLVLEALSKTQDVPSADNPLVLLHGSERLATALGLAARYARFLIAPFGLSTDHSGAGIPPEAGLHAPLALLGLAILIAFSVLFVLGLTRSLRGAAPASFAAALFLFPYLVIGNLFVTIGSIFADRLIYLPSLGFCLLCGVGMGRWTGRAAGIVFVLVLALFTAATWRGSSEWRDEQTIFRAAARASPRSPRAPFVLGNAAAEGGRHEEALALFERSRTLWPDFVGAWVGAATQLAQLGRQGDAESHLREAVARCPECAGAHHNLGLVLRREGRLAEAERSLRKATVYDPSLHRAWAELGHLYFEGGRYESAARAYRRAVALGRPDLVPRLEAAERAAGR